MNQSTIILSDLPSVNIVNNIQFFFWSAPMTLQISFLQQGRRKSSAFYSGFGFKTDKRKIGKIGISIAFAAQILASTILPP